MRQPAGFLDILRYLQHHYGPGFNWAAVTNIRQAADCYRSKSCPCYLLFDKTFVGFLSFSTLSVSEEAPRHF